MADKVAWLSTWAKSVCDDRRRVTHWLPLHQHLDDSAAVAGRLVDCWLPRQVLHRIACDLPDGLEGVRTLACWLAAVHDVGKCSPAFAVQVDELADRMREHGLVAHPALARDPERRAASHALVGHVAVRDWLERRHGFSRRGVANQLGGVVGSHHGVSPEDGQLRLVRSRPDLRGTGPWEQARELFLERASRGVDLQRYRDVRLSLPSQVLLTAIVIVADWIASNADLFALYPISTAGDAPVELTGQEMRQRLDTAWARLDLPLRWTAQPPGVDVDQLFRDRFDSRAAGARPVQAATVQTASGLTRPGLVIVEAPMGAGKTEAALMAAEVLAAASGAEGCFVALPTQATTNAMFERVRGWLERLPGRDGAVSVMLAHGKVSLNDEFAGLVREGRFRGVGDSDDAWLVAHQWLSGRKKGVLASFVVGTIDQVLFAGLKSRHLMLRHLALAGKVVIIDEVHAYDVYMSQYLHRVLHWLGAYGVPVVLLSATLPAGRRAELLAAYDSGTGTTATRVHDRDPGYPVVVSSGSAPRVVLQSGARTEVQLDHLADDLDTLVAYLREYLVDGGCAVIVRNTVTRVQETAARLEAEFGSEHVTVNHSRFLGCDRARIDQDLLRRFGPRGRRPALHIVVASQVVEQSLDVDFDLMVTDLAPVDLVLQRLGRLHRHERDRPARLRTARCALTGTQAWQADPVRAVRGSRRVYGEHTLLRAAALLHRNVRESITLPSDISALVQQAYGEDRVGPRSWQQAMDEARVASEALSRRRKDAARAFLLDSVGTGNRTLIDWVRAGVGDTDDDHQGAAQVRDGEESLEVLVVQQDVDGGLMTAEWIERGGGEPVPLDSAVEPKQARVIAACGVRLPLAMCHPGIVDEVIAALEANRFTSFWQTPLLKGQLVLVLDTDRSAVVRHGKADFRVTYDPRRGLMHERG
ncbi:CRISPR-associated helicase/endonuclease Cas3 [Lentzea jiangxiensis]|uniref:CRISPR-associated endonuclease/helicase Cas3/CRISPR system Cascade subunit CasA n=1 Tax=Lentzea jiangxiensis TaxID=641025 RepID=A0A1H0WTV0_9PSEU|nr:CRISPR-associated helicase/endonuclease Cas3 [Lentzea jiangxiensis]SDP94062.1 CRISPR-associated endonuclease/helicase Cas3/CRISPR system Cascade subunit CasA [Lentzea jiangxiensis]